MDTSLVTLTVTGIFSILPDRTIAIQRPTIDPSIIPIPVYTETPPPTPGLTPYTTKTETGESLDKKLLIGLLVGLVCPILLCIIAIIVLRFSTQRIAKHKGISLSLTMWRPLSASPRPDTTVAELSTPGPRAELPLSHTPRNCSAASSNVELQRQPIADESPSLSSPSNALDVYPQRPQPAKVNASTSRTSGSQEINSPVLVGPSYPETSAPPSYHHHVIHELDSKQ